MKGRAHPMMIFQNLWRVFYLLVIPVLRGFLTALQGSLASWASGAWLDILVLLYMIAVSVLSWRRCVYEYDDEGIQVSSGLFLIRRTAIKWRRVATLSCRAPFFLKPFRVALLRADTVGGSFRDADVNLWLHYESAWLIRSKYQSLRPEGAPAAGAPQRYMPSTSSILAFSLLNASSLGGMIFLATLISQSGRLLGGEFSDMLIGTFEEAARTFALGVPPAAAAIAYALLIGWLIGFLLTVTRYQNLRLGLENGKLMIHSGFFTNRDYVIDSTQINFLDIRQTVTTRLLGMQSLYLSAIGCGKNKDDISCIVPTSGSTHLLRELSRFFPGLSPCPLALRPFRKGFFAYLYPALFGIGGIAAACAAALSLFPGWSDFILFTALMLLVPAGLFLAVCIIDFRTGGIGRREEIYTLRYSRGFSLHTTVIPADKIVKIAVRQSLWQRARGNCDLTLYTLAERRSLHKCRNLPLSGVRELFSL